MESITFVHSAVRCDVCNENPARYHCKHEECQALMYICSNCKPAHDKYKKHGCVQKLVVSVVESKCSKDGHLDRLAPHICIPCQLPVCDECRDHHVEQGHSFTEIQSDVAAKKKELIDSLDQLRYHVKQVLNLTFLAAETNLASKLPKLRKEAEAGTNKILELVKKHSEAIQSQLAEIEQQLRSGLKSAQIPLDKPQSLISEVQQVIDCVDAREIIESCGSLLENTKAECSSIDESLRLFNAMMSKILRLKLRPKMVVLLDELTCAFQKVRSFPLSDAGICSFVAAHPNGGFVMGSSHDTNLSRTSVSDAIVSEEPTPISIKLTFYSADGEIMKVKNIRKLLGNEKLRGITVLPKGEIALLGDMIEIYRPDDLDRDNVIICPMKVIPRSDDLVWNSLVADASGSLLAGDCINYCIYVFSGDACFSHSIPCSGVKPRQLQMIPSGRIIVSQCGIEDSEPMIQILNPDGTVVSSISDKKWDYVFCSADSQENLYVASVRMANAKEDDEGTGVSRIKKLLTLAMYSLQGKREEIIIEDEIVEKHDFSLAVQNDGIMLSSSEHVWVFK